MMTRTLLGAMLVTVMGCKEAVAPVGPTGLPDDVALAISGTWRLSSVKDIPLPWTVTRGPTTREDVVAGSIVLNPNGTYSHVTTYRRTDDCTTFGCANGETGTVTDRIVTLSGAYSGSIETGPVVLTFTFPGGSAPFFARVVGGALSVQLNHEGNQEKWVYVR